jgi:hypothetical protein
MSDTNTATAIALVRAALAGDDEGIHSILATADHEALVGRLLGLVEHFGTAAFGGDVAQLDGAFEAYLHAMRDRTG